MKDFNFPFLAFLEKKVRKVINFPFVKKWKAKTFLSFPFRKKNESESATPISTITEFNYITTFKLLLLISYLNLLKVYYKQFVMKLFKCIANSDSLCMPPCRDIGTSRIFLLAEKVSYD